MLMRKQQNTISPRAARGLQEDFLRRAGRNAEMMRLLAEQLPEDCLFNLVDDRDRIMSFNRANAANCNFRNEYEAVGRRIADLFPPVLAEYYLRLYRTVRRTGKPVLNRPMAHAADRSSTPRLGSVFPVYAADGRSIIGTAAFYRLKRDVKTSDNLGARIKAVTDHVETYYAERLTNTKLAEVAGLALSTFRRVFTERMQITPNDYIATIRVNHARELLTKTNRTLESIAEDCGFYDPSHFVKTFKKLRRETPSEYRRKAGETAAKGRSATR